MLKHSPVGGRPSPRVRPAVNHYRRTIDHRERLWDRARKIAPHHLRFLFQKAESDLTRSYLGLRNRHARGVSVAAGGPIGA
jgi:hypothetical protein